MSFQWEKPPSQAFGELADAYTEQIHRAVLALAERYTTEIEQWMKANRPWTDRTGEAKSTLHSEVVDITGQAVVIIFGHGVDYGVFLELANGGRFSVLFPALDHFLPLIWRDVQQLVGTSSRGRFISG